MYWTLLGAGFGIGTMLWWIVLAQYLANFAN